MKFEQMTELLKYAKTPEELDGEREEIAKWIPKVRIMFSFDQKNHAHQYDLWLHTLYVVAGLPRGLDDDMLYLAALLHDIGKPASQIAGTKEGDTSMHYYGHPHKSLQIVRDEVLPELEQKGVCISGEDRERLLYYVEHHDDPICVEEKNLYKMMKDVPMDWFKKLIQLELSDGLAHIQIPVVAARVEKAKLLSGAEAERIYEEYNRGKH